MTLPPAHTAGAPPRGVRHAPGHAALAGAPGPPEFDRLVARAAERLRPALGPHAAHDVAREVVLDAVRFALRWAGA